MARKRGGIVNAKNKILMLICGSLLTLCFLMSGPSSTVQAENKASQQVLVVYDSKNNTAGNQKKVDALQRVLTSMNLAVRTVSQNEYRQGMLKASDLGVITLINWPQVGLTNQEFVADREQYQGIKLHIGDDLSKSEAAELAVTPKKMYQQQFILKSEQATQQLPFSETLTVLENVPQSAQTFGTITTQQANAKTYPYGLIHNRSAYLPFFDPSGLSFLTAVTVLTTLLNQQGSYAPLLTFTGVSPYSELQTLAQLGAYCNEQNIPFAISTVTVGSNTELAAYQTFTKTLAKLEDDGGIIFLKTPAVGGAGVESGPELNALMTDSLVSLAKNQVYPVGLSSQGYWNQDRVLRENALAQADHWLLLPNDDEVYVKQDNQATTAKASYFAMSASSINSVENTATTTFMIPTALTIKAPHTLNELRDVKNQIKRLKLRWFDPVASGLTTNIQSGTTTIGYQAGTFLLNGQPKELNLVDNPPLQKAKNTAPPVLLKGYFHIQGNILVGLFIVVFLVLVVFIFLGRKIYLSMFKRK